MENTTSQKKGTLQVVFLALTLICLIMLCITIVLPYCYLIYPNNVDVLSIHYTLKSAQSLWALSLLNMRDIFPANHFDALMVAGIATGVVGLVSLIVALVATFYKMNSKPLYLLGAIILTLSLVIFIISGITMYLKLGAFASDYADEHYDYQLLYGLDWGFYIATVSVALGSAFGYITYKKA